MANKYYLNHSVDSPEQASIFANELTWTIFDILREAGSKGLTAQNVHKQVENELLITVSPSKVYDLLRRFYQNKWTHRYFDKDAGAQSNVINFLWGSVEFDEDYENEIYQREDKYMKDDLFPVFKRYLKKTLEDLTGDESAKEWVPRAVKKKKNEEFPGDVLCRKCKVSHEAQEFFCSLLDLATSQFLDSEEYDELLKEHGYLYEQQQ